MVLRPIVSPLPPRWPSAHLYPSTALYPPYGSPSPRSPLSPLRKTSETTPLVWQNSETQFAKHLVKHFVNSVKNPRSGSLALRKRAYDKHYTIEGILDPVHNYSSYNCICMYCNYLGVFLTILTMIRCGDRVQYKTDSDAEL
jgi:hypothetical protein